MLNLGLRQLMEYTRKNKMKVVNIGLKIFCKNKGNQECKVGYRILQEGLSVLLPHMDERRVVPVKQEVFMAFKIISRKSQITCLLLREKWFGGLSLDLIPKIFLSSNPILTLEGGILVELR